MENEILMVRIYVTEAEHVKRKSLMQEVLRLLHDQHRVQGVTVFRGIAGFGAKGEFHTGDILRLNVDLPLVIEFFDEPEVAESAIKLLDDLVPGGHIVSWRAFRHGDALLNPRAP